MPVIETKCSSCGKSLLRYYPTSSRRKNHFCSSKCQGRFIKDLSGEKNKKKYSFECCFCGKKGKSPTKKTFCNMTCYNGFQNLKWKFYYPDKNYKTIKWGDGSGHVYFMTTENSKGVKIGYAKDVYTRARGMQSDHYDKVIILLALSGCNRRDEKFFHDKFDSHRIQGEWYNYTNEILEFIKNPRTSETRQRRPRSHIGP